MLEQCAAAIFGVDKRRCGVGRSVAAHLSFTRSSRNELFLAVLQLAATSVSVPSRNVTVQ